MSDTDLANRIESLTSAVLLMARTAGTRLSRADMCERLGVCGKTLTERVRAGKAPTPGTDGKWLLSEVLEWEAQR